MAYEEEPLMGLVAATEEMVRLSKSLYQKVTANTGARKMSGTIRITLPDLSEHSLPIGDRVSKR